MTRSFSCLMAALGLLVMAGTSELAAQEASSDVDVYVNQMDKLAGIIEGISTAEDVAAAEPGVTEVFDNLAELLLETEDPTALITLSEDERMMEINTRIESAATNLGMNTPEVAMELGNMFNRASVNFMAALAELGMGVEDGMEEAEEYEGGM